MSAPVLQALLVASLLVAAGAQVQYAPQYQSAGRPYVAVGQSLNLVFTGAGLVPAGAPVVTVLVLPPATRCSAAVAPLVTATVNTAAINPVARVAVVPIRIMSLGGAQYAESLTVCYNGAPANVHGAALGPLWVVPECLGVMDINALGDATSGSFTDGTPTTALQRPGTGSCTWRIHGADGCKINAVLSRLDIRPVCGNGTYLLLNADPASAATVCNANPKVFLYAQTSLDVTFTWQTGFTDGTGFQLDWDLQCTPTPIPTPTPTPCEQGLPKWICPEDLVEEAETSHHCKMYPGCDYMTACSDEFLATRCMPIPPNHQL